MSFEDIKIDYQNFNLSFEAKTYAYSRLLDLYEEAPAGSLLKGTFGKKDGYYKAVLRINSSAGSFFAAATGANFTETLKKVIAQMRRHLNKWKSKRFKQKSSRKVDLYERRGDEGSEASVA